VKQNIKKRIAVLQRNSLVAKDVFSLSVSVRIVEALDYLEFLGLIEYVLVNEHELVPENIFKWAQIIILNKHASKSAFEFVKLAYQRKIPIIYDIDDWIFSFPEYSGNTKKNNNHTIEIIKLSNVITVANQELMKRVPEVIQTLNPTYLPNGIWVERHLDSRYYIESECSLKKSVLFTNADFLKVKNAKDEILTALQIFFSNNPDYTLDFYGDPFPEMFSLPFLNFVKRIPYTEYMRSIISGRYLFAICPLGGEEDQESLNFNLCKNPFKYINYGVAKIPCIYSNSEIYTKCVKDHETGLLIPNKLNDWIHSMEKLLNSQTLRSKISMNAFEDVSENYHIKNSAKILNKIIDTLI